MKMKEERASCGTESHTAPEIVEVGLPVPGYLINGTVMARVRSRAGYYADLRRSLLVNERKSY
jgi:hypothetical protein